MRPIDVCRMSLAACAAVGVYYMLAAVLLVPALPYFQLDRALTPQQLADGQTRETTMAYLLVAFGFSACLVGSVTCLAPVIYGFVTGQFIEGPYQAPIPIREQPWRFARFACLGIFLGGSYLVGLVIMARAILQVTA